jgi:hypothetical protein
MRTLRMIVATAGAIALTAPVVTTNALAGGARHQAKAERKVETTGSIDKPMRQRKDMSQRGSWGTPKDVSKRSSWGGS